MIDVAKFGQLMICIFLWAKIINLGVIVPQWKVNVTC